MASTRPHDSTVGMRCAMETMVERSKEDATAACIAASVTLSTLALASSSTSTLRSLSSTLARHRSCRWPTERLPPSAWTSDLSTSEGSSVPQSAMRRCASRAVHSAFHCSASPCSASGSRLRCSVPAKHSASCGTMLRAERRAPRGRDLVSRPSSVTRPLSGSTVRNSAASSVLLPLPVRPTTPRRSRGDTSKVTPLSASGWPGPYRSRTPSKRTAPCCSHPPRGSAGLEPGSSSGGRSAYCCRRSAATMLLSRSSTLSMTLYRDWLRPRP
mmetsp:Transcript_26008/g.88999  ORF Transcript_26008/g.88999 Transcript_26008/m.88999 type:complete len:271 (-) Transcript_26008:521-1333(-)